MGLLLSVLVACVGAIELLDFYCNVRRRLELVVHDCGTKKPPRIELNRDFLSREEIEVECAPTILRGRSKSPRRFLVTEREGDRSRSPSPRRFIVTSEETPGQNLPEFLITEHIQGDNNLGRKFVLVDPNQQKREKSPLPLPKQFIVSESEHSLKDLKCREAIDIQINSLSLEKKSFVDQLSSSNDDATIQKQSNSKQDNLLQELLKERYYDSLCSLEAPGTSAGQSKSFDELVQNSAEEDIEVFHRCPSPYPALELPQRKENICRLANQATTSMLEVDEDSYRSRSSTPEKIDVILHSTTFNTTEYWTNKVLIEPPARNKSESTQSLDAPLGELVREKMEKSRSNDGFLNSLDGVEGKNLSRGGPSRRSFKKKGHRTLGEKSGDTSSTSECNQTKQIDSNESKELTNKPVDSDWLIFSGEYTKAMNKDWHGQHFCCWQCDESLTGQRYVLRDDHPYCVSCYESVFANACEKCSRIIGIDSKDLSYKDKHWHEACFLCTTCGESLVDKQFGSKGDRIYCGRCYDNQFASRCDGCNEIFRAGTKKMEYKTRQWHEKCFCCCVCKVPIGTQSFIPREQEIYCAKCYEEKFATRCIKCNKVITSGGVTYKNEPWHRECFTCTHCSKSLAGERFTSRDEKPYCAECFGELFAKRCFACNKPITGIGGTKFISFEDRHWHNDCFFCAQCRTSLVGRGFITDQDDIICPECAKQRLM